MPDVFLFRDPIKPNPPLSVWLLVNNHVYSGQSTRPDEWLEDREWNKKQDKNSKDRQSQFICFGLAYIIAPNPLVQSLLWIFSIYSGLVRWLLASWLPETSSCQTGKKKATQEQFWWCNTELNSCQIHHKKLLPCIPQAPSAFPQGHQSTSFLGHWDHQVSKASRGHQ